MAGYGSPFGDSFGGSSFGSFGSYGSSGSSGSSGSYGLLPGRDTSGAPGYIKPSASFDWKGDGYAQRMYEDSVREATRPGSMGYGKLPQEPGESWNNWLTRRSDFEKAFGNGAGIATGSNAMNKILGLDSASRASRMGGGGGGGGGGVSYGGGGGGSMQAQLQPIEFYLGQSPDMKELNLNFEETGKRAMEANKPYAEQYKQFAPGTEAGTRSLSNLGATLSSGTLPADWISKIGRDAASLGFSTGMGSRSQIGRNALTRDLGLGTLQVAQIGADMLLKSSQLAQQAQQAMSPIAPTEVFGTAANQASINQQIQNQNLLNAWQTQGLPGQFDIKKGQFIGFQPGSYASTRPGLPGAKAGFGQNWTGSAYNPQFIYS